MKLKPANDTAHLRTELGNPASADLDTKSALEIVEIINREDKKVAKAVKRVLPQIAKAVSAVEKAFRRWAADLCGHRNQRTAGGAGCERVSADV